MFSSVQFVRDLCQERNIPIAKLEKDCGFSNGYLNPKKMSKLPYDRAVVIAKYLGVSENLILTGVDDIKNAPTGSSERQVNHEDIKFALFGGDGEITDAMYEEVRNFAEFVKQREAERRKG